MRSIKRIEPFMKWLTNEWEKSPDQRFGQLLINLGLVEDGRLTWNTEISEYPIPHEIIREIQTWGTNGRYGNDFEDKFIKDLETNHIKNILKTQTHINETPIKEILKKELEFRKTK